MKLPVMMTVLGGRPDVLTLTATTTTSNEAVQLARMTLSVNSEIDWGDGTTTATTAGSTTAIDKTYAAAGTYTIRVKQASKITQVRLESAKIGRLNTAQLARSAITYFWVTAITGSTIDTAHMTAWRPATWSCFSMPSGGTYTINTAHMVDWRPIDIRCYSMPSGGTYTINTAHMVDWRPTTWQCYSMPTGGTYTINTANMVDWRPTTWQCYSMPTGAVTIDAATNFAAWTAATTVRFDGNSLNQASVDKILQGLWAAYPTRTGTAGTINVGGSNAAPSGTYQAANPPATGKEYAYELLNDSQNINPTKKWATVTFTA